MLKSLLKDCYIKCMEMVGIGHLGGTSKMLVLLIFALSSFTPISSFTYLSITIDVLSPMLYVHVHTV